jgi:catechol 2,3-dioxygenase
VSIKPVTSWAGATPAGAIYTLTMSLNLDLEVAHAVIYVHDPEAMIDFYTRVLGFEVTDRGPLRAGGEAEIIFLSQTANHHHQVAFVSGREAPGRSNSVHHVAFRSSGTLDDLRALKGILEDDPAVTGIMPLTHGNAWSVYFSDPEGNGVEVFIDTPWHVAQPQGKPLDLSLSNVEIEAKTRADFAQEPEFGSISEFYQRRADYLAAARPTD